MTGSADSFAGLSRAGLAAFAAARADALGVVVAPGMTDEVIENLAVLQAHARVFLTAAAAVGADPAGRSDPEGAG